MVVCLSLFGPGGGGGGWGTRVKDSPVTHDKAVHMLAVENSAWRTATGKEKRLTSGCKENSEDSKRDRLSLA